MSDCLKLAKEAYTSQLGDEEIDQTYQELAKHYKTLQSDRSNLIADMSRFSDELTKDREYKLKKAKLRQILQMESILDNLQYEAAFRKAGHSVENSVTRSMQAKMAGSSWKTSRSNDNTYSRKLQAMDGFYREFSTDIQGQLSPLFLSKTGELPLVEALYNVAAGKDAIGPHGDLARIVRKYYDRYFDKLRSVGIDVTEREDRIAPNIHNAEKILKLSRQEKKLAKQLYGDAANPQYEFAFQRWNRLILDNIDEDKVFTARNVDKKNVKEVERFQRGAFDNIANRGKSTQEYVNFADKFEKERVYHWKDAQSLINYNDVFGNGAVQDSIVRELANGFGAIEVIKDWGTVPNDTLRKTLNAFDEHPEVLQRTNKAREKEKLSRLLKSMTSSEIDYPGTIDTITSALTTFETITKMGSAVLSSIPDIYNTSKIARQSGKGRFESIPGTLKTIVAGLSKEDQKVLSKWVNNSISVKLGQVSRFFVNPYSPTSTQSKLIHWMYKLNLLENWDQGNKGYAVSVISQHLAENRAIKFEELPTSDKEILDSYNISSEDWDMIRQSHVQIGSGRKEFITPDSIHQLDEQVLRDSLERQGIKNASPVRVQLYRDSIDRKLTTYFRDRQDHAITTPDIIDRDLLSFGIPPERQKTRAALRLMMQFKSFGVSMVRKTILPILRAKGATTNLESLFSGKSNWTGLAAMTVEVMALSYMATSLKNLSLGMSPPSLDHPDTWWQMFKSSMGIFAMAVEIDPRDLQSSIAHSALGPASADIEKASRLGYSAWNDWRQGHGFKSTEKSSYQFLKSNIPYNTFMTKWLWNHFLLNELEDEAYPGKRQRNLRQVKKDTGSEQLF